MTFHDYVTADWSPAPSGTRRPVVCQRYSGRRFSLAGPTNGPKSCTSTSPLRTLAGARLRPSWIGQGLICGTCRRVSLGFRRLRRAGPNAFT